jgi:hypothetical protein
MARALTLARLREISKRQIPTRWGPRYIPAMKANPEEAPGKSKPSTNYSELLQRDIHAMSTPERVVLALALYHPGTFELKEQHILLPKPGLHPLVGHPIAAGLTLPTTSGTIKIAQRLGLFGQHPKVWVTMDNGATIETTCHVAPWLGDFLVFLKDDAGPYVLSWDVKSAEGDHGQPGPGDWAERNAPSRLRRASARDEVYLEYMRELQIRVVRVASKKVDEGLVKVLVRLLLVHHHPIGLAPPQISELIEDYREALARGNPPNDVIEKHARAGINRQEARRVLDQGIWQRMLRVDLYRPIVPDQPLLPERRDVLVEFQDWFRR